MQFCLELPTRVQPGEMINPPLVVKLDKPSTAFAKNRDTGLLWGFVSVKDEAGNKTLAPPRSDLVAGCLSDSVHTLESNSDSDDEDELGYLYFPNLAINSPGNYRLCITLMEHDAAGVTGARNLRSISSPIIRVVETAPSTLIGKDQSAVLESLRQRGLRVSS